MTTNKCNCGCEVCGTKKVMQVTQIESRKVLDPENVAKRGDIMLISKNLNGVWTLTPLSKVTLNAVADAMENGSAAFMLMEWKEPVEEEPPAPENPGGTTDPSTPGTGGETTDPSGSESSAEEAGDGNG